MAKSWLVDGRAIAKKVKTSGLPLAHQINDSGAHWTCPNCDCKIDNSDVAVEWPGLPFGVKFDPSDIQLIEHLAAKCGVGNEKPHQFIDEFIPTLDIEEGICYKHPENLPGARKDGTAVHFFYRTSKAYNTGQRKRRKIYNESTSTNDVRWHKTGKTKAIIKDGVHVGCKKIMVLYGTATRGSKPYKLNWVMHQYHLGTEEDEKEGEYVVSKIFYQPQKQSNKIDNQLVVEESDSRMNQTTPRTPMPDAPYPPRPEKSASYEDVSGDYVLQSPKQELESFGWEDDSQAIDLDAFDDSLFCKENMEACAPLGDSSLNPSRSNDVNPGIADLENLDLGTPPDFSLADLQFSSQDSVFGWIDWL